MKAYQQKGLIQGNKISIENIKDSQKGEKFPKPTR